MSKMYFFIQKCFFWVILTVISFMAFVPMDTNEIIECNDKINHLLSFYVLAAGAEWSKVGRRERIIPGLVVYGAMIEIIQSFIPGRNCSGLDLGADILGICLFYGSLFICKRLVERFS